MNQIINGLPIRDNAVVYVSPYEHNAVARCIHGLSKKRKLIIKEMPLNDSLEIDLEKLKYEFIKDKPDAVFCTHVSNVIGQLMTGCELGNGIILVVAVPYSQKSFELADRWSGLPQMQKIGNKFYLVKEDGDIVIV